MRVRNCRGDRDLRRGRRFWRGFTLVEMLAVLAVVAALVTLALPGVFSARARAVVLRCQFNMGTAHRSIAIYADTNADAYPFAGFQTRDAWVPGAGFFGRIGGRSGVMAGTWSTLFPDEWHGLQWTKALRCPRQPDFDPGAVPAREPPFEAAAYAVPFYYMWTPFWTDPADMTPGTQPTAWRTRLIRQADVQFPSAKALLNEHLAFCATEANRDTQLYWLLDTSALKASVAFCDGSVDRLTRLETLGSPLANGFAFTATLHGVRGRDR